ncbi:MAG: hypothetical protein WCA38_18175 [Candidatus Acidiferrales bacterium]
MFCNSSTFLVRARRNFRWLWLLVPAVAILASLKSYLVLQQLSAVVLFTALFVIFAALIAVFLLLVVAIDHIFHLSMVALALIGRSVQTSIRGVVTLTMRALAIFHLGTGRAIRN